MASALPTDEEDNATNNLNTIKRQNAIRFKCEKINVKKLQYNLPAMASSKRQADSKSTKQKIWDETPSTFTEFGALSSDMKPAGGFFSRLWKKNKENGSPTPTPIAAADDVTDKSVNVSREGSPLVLVQGRDGASLSTSLSRHDSQSSTLSESDSVAQASEDGTDGNRIVPPHRTLTSVLSRLSSILDQRSTTPQTYKDSDFKQYWMPDSSCKECYDCGDKFTTFRRRHHCRICGQIFCSKCCNQELPGKIIGYKGGIRVCTYCCHVVQRYAQQSASTGDVRALEDLRAITQVYHESGSFDFGTRSVSPRLTGGSEDLSPQYRRGESLPDLPGLVAPDLSMPFDLTPQSEFSSQESLRIEIRALIQDSVQLRELWRQICDSDMGVETQTLRIRLRTHENCIVGKELVDWFIKNDKASTRDQASAIGQALLDARYLVCIGNQQMSVFRDDFTHYRPGEAAVAFDLYEEAYIPPTDTKEQENNEPTWFLEITKADDRDRDDSMSESQRSSTVDLESQKSIISEMEQKSGNFSNEQLDQETFAEMPKMTLLPRDSMEEPLPRQDSSVHGLGDDFLKGALFLGKPPMPSSDVITCPHGWRAVEQLREENGERLAYDRLKKAHREHWQALTRQLLSQQSLLLSWESIISTCITQVSHFVRPDVRLEGDDMDIRNYVHIKKVPGGQKNDTSMFHGVIFTKNVAHKKMKTKIMNPLILLLRGTIEFQRVENKFSSLEPQILQERKFMENCVNKMIAYRPNVVVVEKSVSRLAQELLLQAGITLLYNVKLSVMERLARFTQAHIVPSIDGLVSRPNMGFCHDFRVQSYNLPNQETKTLAIFDGCATHLGCTIVLRGGTTSELRRVKHILKFMTYAAYNSLLELCFCMDEFALPQPGADEIGQPFEGLENSTEEAPPSGKSEDSTSVDNSNADDQVHFRIGDGSTEADYVNMETDELEAVTIPLQDFEKDSCGIDSTCSSGRESKTEDVEQKSEAEKTKNEMNNENGVGEEGAEHNLESMNSEENEEPDSEAARANERRKMSMWVEVGYKDDGGPAEVDEINLQDGSERAKMWTSGSEVVLGDEASKDTAVTENEAAKESRLTGNEGVRLNEAVESHFSDEAAELNPWHYASASLLRASKQGESGSTSQPRQSPMAQLTEPSNKSRLSGSHLVDASSGRSTPDVSKFSTDNIWSSGIPQLVGNMMCIIPPSAIPSSPPVKEGPVEVISERRKHYSASDIASEETLSSEFSTVQNIRIKELNDFAKETGSLGQSSSPALALVTSKDDNSCPSKVQVKYERCSSFAGVARASTSKLTELTDFSDPLLGYQNTQDETIFNSANAHKISLKEIKQTQYKRFRKALDGVHLSVSPYHKYQVPFIETDKGARSAVRKYMSQDIFWSSLFEGEAGQRSVKGKVTDTDSLAKQIQVKSNVQILDCHAFIFSSMDEPIWANSTQTILADFRARGGRIQISSDSSGVPNSNAKTSGHHAEAPAKKSEEPFTLENNTASSNTGPMWEKRTDCLDPLNHQKIMVLFSSFSYKSHNHPYPCVYPWVVTMEFYGRNDITLGGFLERFCFRKQYSCPSPTCDTPMTDHVRRFVHGTGCINVLLKSLENEVPGGKDNILMWSWCRKCKQPSPVVPISSDTWSLSFAKYLDLRFHSGSFLRRGSAEPCPHSLHQDHFQYFGHRNVVASFKYASISLKELALPAATVTLKPPTFDAKALIDSVKNITYRAMDRYSQILESTMKLKQELTGEAQQRTIAEFLSEQQSDTRLFRDAATNIQMKIKELISSVAGLISSGQTELDLSFHLYSIFDNINLLKRHICEDVNKWNARMQEFMAHQQKKSRGQNANKKDKDSTANASDELSQLEKSWKADKSSIKPLPPQLSVSSAQPSGQSASGPPSPQPVVSGKLTTTTTTTTTQQRSPSGSLAVPGSQTVMGVSINGEVPQVKVSLVDDAVSGGTQAKSSLSVSPNIAVSAASSGNDKSSSETGSYATAPSSTSLPSNTTTVTSTALNVASLPALATQMSGQSLGNQVLQHTAPPSVSQSLTSSTTVMTPPIVVSQASESAVTATAGVDDTPDGLFHDLKGFTRRFLFNSSFSALPLPFDLSEHHTLPLCERVPVYISDHEPSSIIAYALSSSEYLYRLREIQTAARPISSESSASAQTSKQGGKLSDLTSSATPPTEAFLDPGKKNGVLSFLRGASRDTSPQQNAAAARSAVTVDTVRYVPAFERSISSGAGTDEFDTTITMDDSTPSPDEKPKAGGSSAVGAISPHIELQFTDSSSKFYCRIYFADQFRKLRKLLFPGSDNLFIRSLSRCKAWEAKGGKSGSAFSKTIDDRFILKQMSTMEVESFEKFGPQYFNYIKTCTIEQQPTALGKILGVFRIGFRNSHTNNALRQDVLVMENLFYNRKISQKFDLKGSMRNRLVNTSSKRAEEELVLLDENLLKGSVENPFYMRPHCKYVLKAAITSDSAFLSTNLVMDYSLLVGLDEDTSELVVGIIDYIRTFTWDKKLEMVVKSSWGGQGKMPTVVSPQLYRGRFLEAMDRYFLPVPDTWMGLGKDTPVRASKGDVSESKELSKK